MGSWGLCLALGGGANRREAAQLGLSCKPALLCGIMEVTGADPDLADEDVLDIELPDDNLEEEEDEVEEVFESPRKRPSILLSLTGCSRVALSPFADLEVPQTKLDPPTPSSPLPRSPSQFLRYSELQVFIVNLRENFFLVPHRRLSHSRRLSRASKASMFDDEEEEGADQDDSQCPERPVTEAHMAAFFGAIGK